MSRNILKYTVALPLLLAVSVLLVAWDIIDLMVCMAFDPMEEPVRFKLWKHLYNIWKPIE